MISVIVPVYKAEKYLRRCVDSILAQTYTDFELLLIDDGSPDNCGALCDEYAEKDSRVCVCHKENGGVSSARNLGLDNARGEWVSFIDADDYVLPTYLSQLTENLDADWIVGGYKETYGPICLPIDELFQGYRIIDFCNKYLGVHIARACWGGLYKTSIVRRSQVKFSTNIRYGEDTLFNSSYIVHCDKIRTIKYSDYIYCNDPITENKYILDSDELSRSLSLILYFRRALEKKYNQKIENDSDAVIFLNKYPLEELKEERGLSDYYNLCKECFPNLSWDSFYSDEVCSPIIRLISIVKRKCEEKEYDALTHYCKLSSNICKKMEKCPNFRFKDFYVWHYLLKYRKEFLLRYLMGLYFFLKRMLK